MEKSPAIDLRDVRSEGSYSRHEECSGHRRAVSINRDGDFDIPSVSSEDRWKIVEETENGAGEESLLSQKAAQPSSQEDLIVFRNRLVGLAMSHPEILENIFSTNIALFRPILEKAVSKSMKRMDINRVQSEEIQLQEKLSTQKNPEMTYLDKKDSGESRSNQSTGASTPYKGAEMIKRKQVTFTESKSAEENISSKDTSAVESRAELVLPERHTKPRRERKKIYDPDHNTFAITPSNRRRLGLLTEEALRLRHRSHSTSGSQTVNTASPTLTQASDGGAPALKSSLKNPNGTQSAALIKTATVSRSLKHSQIFSDFRKKKINALAGSPKRTIASRLAEKIKDSLITEKKPPKPDFMNTPNRGKTTKPAASKSFLPQIQDKSSNSQLNLTATLPKERTRIGII
eukprot:CAMPEP_0114992576 /NCGR_PEP_ID=MMETSP0216-20121206/12020_1 /TAXON_ID=223996 /ORGANISM="Protocruzia adherens, Strain Boccale" /LENGTH=402 /DNA_ID=CAMNT_0002356061 /DNA_START=90 /DNA_END=1298 /DNA_ORIENTATION=+